MPQRAQCECQWASKVWRVTVEMSDYGAWSPKATWLYSTMPWFGELGRPPPARELFPSPGSEPSSEGRGAGCSERARGVAAPLRLASCFRRQIRNQAANGEAQGVQSAR
eukprot:166542-Alexandrium_andersonii.AAC.1